MEALCIAVAIQAIVIAVLAGSVPFLWWKGFRLESKLEALDETLATFLEAAGLGKEQKK